MTSHVTLRGTWDASRTRLSVGVGELPVSSAMRRLQPQDGEAFAVRIEREADAKTNAQIRMYFRLNKAISDYTGYNTIEMHELLKSTLLPADAPKSLAQCSKEQLSQLIDDVYRYTAETIGLVLDVDTVA